MPQEDRKIIITNKMNKEMNPNEARQYLEDISSGKIEPADLNESTVCKYSDGSYFVSIPSVHNAIRSVAKKFADEHITTLGEGLVEVAENYCDNALMYRTLIEWYCCYTPKKDKNMSLDGIAHDENIALPKLKKILTERVNQIGKQEFENFENKLIGNIEVKTISKN